MKWLPKANAITLALLFVAIAALVWQHFELRARRDQLADLETRRKIIWVDASTRLLGNQARDGDLSVTKTQVSDLLKASQQPLDAQGILDEMRKRDEVGSLPLYMAFARMDSQGLELLIDEIMALKCDSNEKASILRDLIMFAPLSDPKMMLERVMELHNDVSVISQFLSRWAIEDPEAAYLWYQEKLEAGDLTEKSIHGSLDPATLLGGIARQDPQRALNLFEELTDENVKQNACTALAEQLAADMNRSGDATHFEKLIGMLNSEDQKLAIVSAMKHWASTGSLEKGVDLIDRHLTDPEARGQAMVKLVTSDSSKSFQERAEWLLSNSSSTENSEVITHLIKASLAEYDPQIGEWLKVQGDSETRDQGFTLVADWQARRQYYDRALDSAQVIQDESVRERALTEIGRRWLSQNPKQARERLPQDLLQRLEMEPTE